jgi:hypothetical protein
MNRRGRKGVHAGEREGAEEIGWAAAALLGQMTVSAEDGSLLHCYGPMTVSAEDGSLLHCYGPMTVSAENGSLLHCYGPMTLSAGMGLCCIVTAQ